MNEVLSSTSPNEGVDKHQLLTSLSDSDLRSSALPVLSTQTGD